jgi:hypothetical protein
VPAPHPLDPVPDPAPADTQTLVDLGVLDEQPPPPTIDPPTEPDAEPDPSDTPA